MGTKKPLAPNEMEFEQWIPALKRSALVRHKGRVFSLSGETIVLFPLPVLAGALGRDAKTLKRWEKAGLFPKPMWKVPDGRCTRWYSSNQIRAIRDEHEKLSGGDRGLSHSPHFPLETFFSRVREIFYKADAATIELMRKQKENG